MGTNHSRPRVNVLYHVRMMQIRELIRLFDIRSNIVDIPTRESILALFSSYLVSQRWNFLQPGYGKIWEVIDEWLELPEDSSNNRRSRTPVLEWDPEMTINEARKVLINNLEKIFTDSFDEGKKTQEALCEAFKFTHSAANKFPLYIMKPCWYELFTRNLSEHDWENFYDTFNCDDDTIDWVNFDIQDLEMESDADRETPEYEATLNRFRSTPEQLGSVGLLGELLSRSDHMLDNISKSLHYDEHRYFPGKFSIK